MKLNLRCKRCGNTEEFYACNKTSEWSKEKEKWQPVFSPRDFVLCGKCNSTEIEELCLRKKEVKNDIRTTSTNQACIKRSERR